MDLITFHAKRGAEAAGYFVMDYVGVAQLLDFEMGGIRESHQQVKQTWCRGCAITEALYVTMKTGGNWPPDRASAALLLENLVGNEPPAPSIICIVEHGTCAKCEKWFGLFARIESSSMFPNKPHPHANDTWRKSNRGKIR